MSINRNRKQRKSHLGKRRLLLEKLGNRELLASDLMNPINSLDVNNDQTVSSVDALIVVNHLQQDHSSRLAGEGEAGNKRMYPDTNGDSVVSAVDALMVINELNAEGESAPMSPTPMQPTLRKQTVDAGYDVVIRFDGDYVDLQVSTVVPGTITLQPLDSAGNPIPGQPAQQVPIRGSLIIHASGSGNQLSLRNANIPNSLIVHAKGHENTLDTQSSRIGDDLLFFGGDQNDHVRLGNDTYVHDITKIETRRGEDRVEINGAHLRRDVVINLGRDNDSLAFMGTTAERNVFVYGEHGNDTVVHEGFNVGHSHHIYAHSGDDIIAATDVAVGRSLFVYGHEGEDFVSADNVRVGDDLHAYLGPHDDQVQVRNSTIADYATVHASF